MDDLLDGSNSNNTMPEPVPNVTAVLVLGIISIVGCFLYGIPGLICGIISLSLHRKDKSVYLSNPEKYDASFRTSKAGFICGIIGVVLSALYIIVLLFVVAGLMSAPNYR